MPQCDGSRSAPTVVGRSDERVGGAGAAGADPTRASGRRRRRLRARSGPMELPRPRPPRRPGPVRGHGTAAGTDQHRRGGDRARSRPRRGAKVRSASADAEARRAPRSVGRRSPGCRPAAERPAGRIHRARGAPERASPTGRDPGRCDAAQLDSPSTPTTGTRSTRRPTNCWRTARCSYKPTRSWPICFRRSDELVGRRPVPIVSSCRDCLSSPQCWCSVHAEAITAALKP